MTEPSPPSPHRLAPCGHPACKFGFIVVASVLGVPLSVHPRRPTANGKQKDPVSRGERRLLACNCLCASRKGSWGADQLAGAGRVGMLERTPEQPASVPLVAVIFIAPPPPKSPPPSAPRSRTASQSLRPRRAWALHRYCPQPQPTPPQPTPRRREAPQTSRWRWL